MLQQTQVMTVLPRYLAWLEQFPDIQTLAAASLDDVLKAWEGLGYYRRARFIHKAASEIITRHNGNFPTVFNDIMALPGIGRSTAGAIASFSFGQPTPVLDGNVKRILKRWYNTSEATDKELWLKAQHAIDTSGKPADWNQAVMELGATICSPRNPNCKGCPVSNDCLSTDNVQATTPAKRPKVKDVHWQVELHTDPERGIWLSQRSDSGIWASLWTPPIIELNEPPSEPPGHIHQLTHRRIHLYGKATHKNPTGHGAWFLSLDTIALPTGIHQLFQKLGVIL